MNVEPRPPHGVILGAMKCGTTALFRFLATHYPDLRPSSPKDTGFFLPASAGGRSEEGYAAYAAYFEPGPGVRLEASTRYAKYPDLQGCAARLHHCLPNARLVYLYRDPFERALSHFFHNLFVDGQVLDINNALNGEPSKYLDYGDYATQLGYYTEHFDDDQLLLLNIIERPLSGAPLAALERHLGLASLKTTPTLVAANTTLENAERSPLNHAQAFDDKLEAARRLGWRTPHLLRTLDACDALASAFEVRTGTSVEPWIRAHEALR